MPEGIRTPSGHPSASGPSTSQRRSGAPSRRTKLSALGTVHTRASSRAVSSATAVCTFPAQDRETAAHTLSGGTSGLVGAALRRAGWGRGLQVGAVTDLADQLLDHVLEGGHAESAALGVHHPGHVGTPALELLERVVQEVVGPHGCERPDPLVLDRA